MAALPCFFADGDPELRRLDLPVKLPEQTLWLLSHVDLRTTARVRACRDWLVELLHGQRELLEGRRSRWLGDSSSGALGPSVAEQQATALGRPIGPANVG